MKTKMNLMGKMAGTFMLLLALAFASCSDIPNKSISEELSTKELADAIESDSAFADLYTMIRSTYDSLDKVDQARYYNITYRDLNDFHKFFIEDTDYWKPLHEKWDKEWYEKYGPQLQKADSIIAYWQKQKEDNVPEKYVSIELANVSTEYYSYTGGVRHVSFGFSITPLKGSIDQVEFHYRFIPKISGDDGNHYYDILNSHYCISTSPITSPVVRYWQADYSDEKRFGGMTAEQILRDYDLKIDIDEIRYEGRNINEETLGIPESVRYYLDYGFEDFGKGRVVKEFIDTNFMERYEYSDAEVTKICKEKDEPCFNFFKLMMQRRF